MDLAGLLKSQFLCHLVLCYVFIASGLIINTTQLLTLVLWPINKQLFRKINCRLSYCISSRKCPVPTKRRSLPRRLRAVTTTALPGSKLAPIGCPVVSCCVFACWKC